MTHIMPRHERLLKRALHHWSAEVHYLWQIGEITKAEYDARVKEINEAKSVLIAVAREQRMGRNGKPHHTEEYLAGENKQ